MVFKKHLNYFKRKSIYSIFFLLPCSAFATDFTAILKSKNGNPVNNAVITLTSRKPFKLKKDQTFIIDQINKAYVPHVTVIQPGNHISFPNKDNIRHHVYSFSDAKKFELPLYEGTPTNPVTFNKTGIIVLGCNIHDWMRAYIFVTKTPYFGISDDSGNIQIKNIPGGIYSLQTWHPQIINQPKEKVIKILDGKTKHHQQTISLKPNIKIRRAPKAKRRKY